MVSPNPSSSADMVVWTLVITIISAMDLKADDVYLVVSLSGAQKQRSPVHKKGSTNPWSGHTFVFTVDEAAVLAGCLKFKIKKVQRIFRLKKGVGEVDVPVRDLLGKGGGSDVKPKVMTREVRSSSGEAMAVLDFSYQFGQQFPIEAPPADETVTGNPAAAAPPASNSVASYPPPVPGAAPTPSTDEPVAGYPAAAAPPASSSAPSYPPPALGAAPPSSTDDPVTGYPATVAPPASSSAPSYLLPASGAAPPLSTDEPVMGYPAAEAPPAYLANAVPTYGHPPPVHVHPPAGRGYRAPPPPAPYLPPPPWAAPYTQPAHLANALLASGYGPPAHAHPPAGPGYPEPPPPAPYLPPPLWATQHIQPADLANALLASGYGPPAHAHPPAGHGYQAPPPHTGGNFVPRVMSGVAVEALSNMFESVNDFGPDDGVFSDAWF